jgi:hypothetical protein
VTLLSLGAQDVVAEAGLAYVPCNLECVHGPFCAQIAAGVAAALLGSSERLEALEFIEWKRPVRRRVRIEASVAPLSAGNAEVAVSGRFETSRGRQIAFRMTERPDVYVVDRVADNAIAQSLVAHGRAIVRDACWCLPLPVERLSEAEQRGFESPAVRLATLLDLVAILILNIEPGVPMLARRCVGLPTLSDRIAPGLGLELQLRCRRDLAQSSERSGLLMVPYEFRYSPVMSSWATWVMAQAPAGVDQMLRVLHERS